MTYGRGAELNLDAAALLNDAVKVSGGCWPRSPNARTVVASYSRANAASL